MRRCAVARHEEKRAPAARGGKAGRRVVVQMRELQRTQKAAVSVREKIEMWLSPARNETAEESA